MTCKQGFSAQEPDLQGFYLPGEPRQDGARLGKPSSCSAPETLKVYAGRIPLDTGDMREYTGRRGTNPVDARQRAGSQGKKTAKEKQP